MIRSYLIHTVLIAFVTAILSTQWTPTHIHLSNSHGHNAVHHKHVSQVHSHHSLDDSPTHDLNKTLEASHHSNNLSIVELDYEFHSKKIGKWDKTGASINAITFWQQPYSAVVPPALFDHQTNSLLSIQASINRPRGPPYLI